MIILFGINGLKLKVYENVVQLFISSGILATSNCTYFTKQEVMPSHAYQQVLAEDKDL